VLTKEQNERLTQTNKGTPCGELMRRYWLPVATSSEIPPDSRTPVPVTILGEELVLFRNVEGKLGLIELHCLHRAADLSYGFVDACGLRCLYHGWAYDVDGRCTDQPGLTSESFRQSIRSTAYPCREVGGLVLAYLGPGEPPVFPRYGFGDVPEGYFAARKVHNDCNYLQGVDGEIDPHHVAFLHGQPGTDLFDNDLSPRMIVEEASHGMRLKTVRSLPDGKEYVRHSNFIMPCASSFVSEGYIKDGFTMHWHVPITDESHWKYLVYFQRSAPLQLPDYYQQEVDEFYHLRRNRANRYLQDRLQDGGRTKSGMGMYFQSHDAYATESQGAIQDRTREHLTAMDVAIIRMRRCLNDGMDAVADGRDPQHVLRPPSDGTIADLVTDSAVVTAGAA
jgi:phenylpropionate dioxygenase-like ring-hydroxylating dioxygenase large terminal subunit